MMPSLGISSQRLCLLVSPLLGLDKVPWDFPPDTTLLDLQNNKITEIKEGAFKNLKDLHVRIILSYYLF